MIAADLPSAPTGSRVEVWRIVALDSSILMGFGFEGITSQAQRNEVMRRTLDHLLGQP